MRRLSTFLLVLCFIFFCVGFVRADEIDDIGSELSKLKATLEESQKATKPLEADLNKLSLQLTSIKNKLNSISVSIAHKEKQLVVAENALVAQKRILDSRVSSHYKNIKRSQENLLSLIVSNNISKSMQGFFYQKKATDNDKQVIVRIVTHMDGVEKQKAQLDLERSKLASTRKIVDEQSVFLGKEVGKAKQFQTEISSKIAALSARQQQIVAEKLGRLNIPRSAGTSARGCSSDLTNGKSPGFSPAIGFFTYGAPHRNGLNQYGALGRAKSGQNEEQILAEYYPGMSLKKDYDQNLQVNVDGHGNFSIEDYVKRIWEVPNSWGDDGGMSALKAQAVAARTYALNSMQRNGHICTTEACQVFRPEAKGGNWEQAVEATRGWVMMDGGNPGFTQYASTHGGYILNLTKFDGHGGNPTSFAELNERAYDKMSPWFYCNWGSRSQYNNTAWLRSEEVADIANVILLARYSDVDKDHLYQIDKPNPTGKEVWGHERVKTELRNRGGSPVGNGSDASVAVDFGSGKTTQVNVGGTSFSPVEFKNWFNLRAPENIQIVGPLFNIERK